MRLYDVYGEKGCQIKVGERAMLCYVPGNTVLIPDGVYVCHEGLVVIHNGIFVCELDDLYTKWGDKLDKCVILDSIKPDNKNDEEPFTNGV
jgi:hypothetical protein